MINGPPLANVQGLVTPRPFFLTVCMDRCTKKKPEVGNSSVSIQPGGQAHGNPAASCMHGGMLTVG